MTAWNYWEGFPTSFLHSVWTIWRCKMVWPPQCIKFYTSSPVAQRSLQSCPFLSSILGWLNTRAATGQSASWSWGGWDFLHRALISRVESIFSHRRSRKESMTAEKKREKRSAKKSSKKKSACSSCTRTCTCCTISCSGAPNKNMDTKKLCCCLRGDGRSEEIDLGAEGWASAALRVSFSWLNWKWCLFHFGCWIRGQTWHINKNYRTRRL